MAVHRNGRAFECVVVDVDTQYDFCDPDGAYPVANVHEFHTPLRDTIAWAKRNYAPVISSIESHRPKEPPVNGHGVYCVDGSPGQRKLDFTIFRHSTRIEVDNTLACPIDLFKRFQQVIFRNRTDDLLSNPKADDFFNLIRTREFILFGVGLEGAIKALTLGLLTRAKQVSIVVDACGYWNQATADLSIRQIVAKGARAITVAQLLERKLDRSRRRPTALLRRLATGNRRDARRNGWAKPNTSR